MMKRLMHYCVSGGGTLAIEVDEPLPGPEPMGFMDDMTDRVTNTFEAALERVQPAIQALGTALEQAKELADDVEVEFGIKLGGTAGAFIACSSGEANFKVKLTWRAHRV